MICISVRIQWNQHEYLWEYTRISNPMLFLFSFGSFLYFLFLYTQYILTQNEKINYKVNRTKTDMNIIFGKKETITFFCIVLK